MFKRVQISILFGLLCVGCDSAAKQQQAEDARRAATATELKQHGESMHEKQKDRASPAAAPNDGPQGSNESENDESVRPSTAKSSNAVVRHKTSLLLTEFIYHLDVNQDMEIGHAPEDVIAWIEGLGLPMSIRRFLQWAWPQVDSQIGHIAIMSSAKVRSNDLANQFTSQKLLWLGSAGNGDFFVLDYSTEQCIPGFITHEECWTGTGVLNKELRQYFQPIAPTLESLLYRLVERRYVPRDYYAASDFNAFLDEERRTESVGRR